MGNDAKRTPGKWTIEERIGHSSFGTRDVITAQGVTRIAVVSKRGVPSVEIAAANAAFIVRACNAHDALVALAEDIRDWLENAPIDYSNGNVHGGFDEGDVYGWQYHAELKVQCKEAIALATEAAHG